MVSVSQGVVYVYPSQVPFCHSQVRSRFQWMTKGELYLRIQRLGRIKTTTTVHTEREEGESRWSTIMMADHHEHSRPQAGDRVLGCIARSDGGRRRGSVGRRSSAWMDGGQRPGSPRLPQLGQQTHCGGLASSDLRETCEIR